MSHGMKPHAAGWSKSVSATATPPSNSPIAAQARQRHDLAVAEGDAGQVRLEADTVGVAVELDRGHELAVARGPHARDRQLRGGALDVDERLGVTVDGRRRFAGAGDAEHERPRRRAS